MKKTLSIVALFCINLNVVYAEINLKFGIYTSDKPTTMVIMFRPILNALEKGLSEKMGETVKIRLQVANTYEQGIYDLVNSQVDFSRMGPASYILSKQQNPNLKLLVMESNKGKKTFSGIICVQESSSIRKIHQLKGRSFAFGNENSTIGRYLSQHLLTQNGVTAKDLKRFRYLGRHDRVGAAVGAAQYDAGALKESTYKKLKKKGVKIRKLASFENVTKPWIANSKMDGKLYRILKETLLNFNDTVALKKIKKQGFLPTSDNDYAIIRESMNTNAVFFAK